MSLSNDMVIYRAKENISQSELGKRCGLTVQTICSIETGTQTPTRVTEAKIRLVIGEEKKEDAEV